MKQVKKITIIFVTILFVIVISGVNKIARAQDYKSVNVAELKKVIQHKRDILILDVRTQGEYTGSLRHIKGSKLIPVDELEARINEISAYKNKPVYVICRSGNRSVYATQILNNKGFKKAFNVLGGMIAWVEARYPVN